ncbi:MAG: hypothetical protein ABI690_00340 [Chloroflexota bacterium]
MIDTDFSQPLMLPWRITEIGKGLVEQSARALQLTVPPTSNQVYSDAQLTDYAGKSGFVWRPPLRMTVRATMSADLKGTAGFGFWNHPFVPGEKGFRLPQATWFFFSAPPSDMALAKGVPGPGWKAATINATRWQFLAMLPTAPIGLLLMRVPALYQRLWPIGQQAIGVSEQLLDSQLLLDMRTYILEWHPNKILFLVDDRLVHQAAVRLNGPLGFIIWVDNQYAVVTPQGKIGFGLVDIKNPQSLIVESVRIE